MVVQPSCLSLAAHLCLGFLSHGAGLWDFAVATDFPPCLGLSRLFQI